MQSRRASFPVNPAKYTIPEGKLLPLAALPLLPLAALLLLLAADINVRVLRRGERGRKRERGGGDWVWGETRGWGGHGERE